MRVITVAIVLALGVGVSAGAEVIFLGGLDSDPETLLHRTTRYDCVVGNLNPPVDKLDWYLPYMRDLIAYMFIPAESGCQCEDGFRLEAIHYVVVYEGSEPSITVDMWMGLTGQRLPAWPGGCMEPEPGFWNMIAWETVELPGPGYYEIVIPGQSECCYMEHFTGPLYYALEVSVIWPDDLYLARDGFPGSCTTFASWTMGAQWFWDSVDAEGNAVIWADVTCCENPIGVEDRTWGAVKATYR